MVDDRHITREDADRRASINVRQSGGTEADPDYEKMLRTARKGAVDLLVQAYVLQAAATESIEIPTRDLEVELQSWKMRVPSQQAWDEFLGSNKLTEAEFKEILLKDMRIRKQMEKAAAREVSTPSPEEAQQIYDVNTLAFSWPYRVRYDEIRWITDAQVSQASREQARKGMEQLAADMARNPSLFDELLAKKVPLGYWGPAGIPDLPYLSVKNLPPQIQETLKVLVQGEISPVIETPQGFSLIRIASLSQTYDSAYNEILDSIYTERCRANLTQWIERQKKKHKIRICDVEYYRGGISGATAEASGEER